MPERDTAPVVRVLHSHGCGSWERAFEEATQALRALGISGAPEAVLVNGYDDGVRYGFRGSPTVTVDGVDVEQDPPGEPGLAFG